MKKFFKELAWKVTLCVMWIQCTPWFERDDIPIQGTITICGLFIIGLDLIRWGLKN